MGRLLVFCLVIAVVCGFSVAGRCQPQPQGQFEPPGKREIAKYPLVLDAPVGPGAKTVDPIKLRAEANELADLARSVPSDFDQVVQGKLPKDITQKLKRIEKLAKQMRNELGP